MRTAKSCGPDAAVLASSCVGSASILRIERDIHAATVAKEPFTGEITL